MIFFLLVLAAANWRLFQRMGNKGWECLIPGYSTFCLWRALYGSGWTMLLPLVPFYGIYRCIKFHFDLAASFGKGSGFGVGLWLLNPIFVCILGFSGDQFLDGSVSTESTDSISKFLDSLAYPPVEIETPAAASTTGKDGLDLLADIAKLHEEGILSDEEYQAKKSEILQNL